MPGQQSRWGWLGLAVASALVVGACGDINVPIPGIGGPTPTATAFAVKQGGTTVQVGGGLPAGFPSSFPLPPQHQVQSATDDGRQFAVVLSVQSTQGAYDFYKGALPGAGYQVRDLGSTNVAGAEFNGGLQVTGNGVSGELAFTTAGPSNLVSIRLERGGGAATTPAAAGTAAVASIPTIVVPTVPNVVATPAVKLPAATPPSSVPTTVGLSVATATPAGTTPSAPPAGQLPATFPSAFPLPPQYQVQSASDDGRQVTVVLGVTSAQAAYDFYKGALPLAGFQVQEEGRPSASGGVFTGSLSLAGNGVNGRIAFTSAGTSHLVTIGLVRGGAQPAATPGPAATSAPAATPAPAATRPLATTAPPSGGTQLPAGLPANFPMPPGYQVQTAAQMGQQVAVILMVPSAQDAYEFYKRALPGAGYQVEDLGGTTAAGTFSAALSISGNGVTGDLAFTSSAGTNIVTISLRR